MSDNLGGGAAILQAVITITRKATGETEEYLITGTVKPEQAEQEDPE